MDPQQACIPGGGWASLPQYDNTARHRSSAFNEHMHVEWETFADSILASGAELPAASVVAKAGSRSCAVCCRSALALARPTGRAFITVDLAEDDKRGTFHFAAGDRYLPVPKEACDQGEVAALKRIVADAQDGRYASSQDICEAVLEVGAPVDEVAQGVFLGDRALLPGGCAGQLRGRALLEVIHAEHFARLPAEYGASILRDTARPWSQRSAVRQCRNRARERLTAAWRPHLCGISVDLEAYAAAAVAPLLPEEPGAYATAKLQLLNGGRAPRPRRSPSGRLTAERLHTIDESAAIAVEARAPGGSRSPKAGKKLVDEGDDTASTVAPSTASPSDAGCMAHVADGTEEPEEQMFETF